MSKESLEYNPPEGFEPVLRYPDGKTGVPLENLGKLVVPGLNRDLEFDLSEFKPKLPLKKSGLLWSTGWDIPTRYAIDADNQCWADDAYGNPLGPVSRDQLLSEAEDESDKNEIRRILGIELPWPDWALTAKAQGWTPPQGWEPPK